MKKIKNNIQSIICILSLTFLFSLPFINGDFGYGVGLTFKGFGMASGTYFGYLLIILPILLISSSFMPTLSTKKDRWSITIPIICIASWIVTVLWAEFVMSAASDSTLGSGAWLSLLCYIALFFYGAKHNPSELNKIISKIKNKQ